MAPKLAESQHSLISDMLCRKSMKAHEIAAVAECSLRSVYAIRSNTRRYGSTTAPPIVGGRPRSITPVMLDALYEHLIEKPDLYHDEMALFLLDEFGIEVSTQSIGRTLRSKGWTKKKIRRIAKGRNADLRDFYHHNMEGYRSDQLVFVDESGCDKRIGFRRTGWAPSGVTPVQIAQFQREQRWQILPAYTQDGILFSLVFQGSTDSAIFEEFIEQLLPSCNPFPGKYSVLVMDNASIHRSERIRKMCDDVGVRVEYLPPYSPDLNPVEEKFAQLKAFIKRHWQIYVDDPDQGFDTFLEWCIDVVGKDKRSARGHFRHAGWEIKES